MTIAEQITRAKADLDAVYAAGKAAGGGGENALKYAKQVDGLFSGAIFPDEYKLVVELDDDTAPTNLTGMFRNVTGLEKLTFIAPTDRTYNGSYFIYGSSSKSTDVKELILPEGIKFSDFSRFVGYSRSLITIEGSINLSENTTTQYSFNYCSSLEKVRFMPGTIGLSISFSHSPNLSDDSIASIVLGLADLREQTKQTLTVHSTVYDKIVQLRDENETGDGKNPYDPAAKNWELVRGA